MKTLTKTLAVVGAGATVVGLARRHRAITAAAPELRHPRLYVPMSLRNGLTLGLARRLIAAAPAAPSAVPVRTEIVPGDAGRPGTRVLVYERPDRSRPSAALLWIHGGGLVMGAPEMGNDLCGRVADELGALVVGVDYRLAPEHPFPAGLDDCYATLCWLHAQAGAWGIDTDRIAVGGDSAGGGLAASLAQMAHDRGGPDICFQLLEYPMLDDRTCLRTDRAASAALVWSNGSNRYGWGAYLAQRPGRADVPPHSVPARRADLAGLPPAWVGVGDIDLFHDEDVEYARRLQADGVPCELHVEPGMYHGADQFAAGAPSMRRFRDRMVDALRVAWS